MAMMQDPSQGVAQPLQNHVHLVSGHRFPIMVSMSIEQALRYLLDAHQIVKALAPMSWAYVSCPQDGSIWLEWLSTRHDGRFPSDGYVWGDPESTYQQDFGGYKIEVMVHTVGYRPGMDQMASHARTRYHLVAKSPSVQAAPPDPSLWIVHYHPADPSRILPVGSVPFSPQMRQIVQERRWLESQGRLEKKDFMLHDRAAWPTISVPSSGHLQPSQSPAYPMAPPARNAWPQQPPQKRQRQHAPAVMSAAGDGSHDTSIEDEENTALGDFFDHVTHRDISMARYTQHHRWMEEVFSSPYSTNQIVPSDLGLGLMGELKGLTDGILEPPSVDITDRPSSRPKESNAFTNLNTEQVDEFSKRVDTFLKEGRAEVERMRADHAAKMTEWRKTRSLIHAEKRLRYATWQGHEDAVPGFRLEQLEMNNVDDDIAGKETVEDVVRDVEGLLCVKITSHKEATLVQWGGLEKEGEPSRDNSAQTTTTEQAPPVGEQQPAASAPNNAKPEPITYHQDPFPLPPITHASQPTLPPASSVSQENLTTDQAQIQSVDVSRSALQDGPTEAGEELNINDDSLIGGMELDVDASNLDFEESALDASGSAVSIIAESSATVQPPQTTLAGNVAGTADVPILGDSEQVALQAPPASASAIGGEVGALGGDGGLAVDDVLGGTADLDNSMFDSTFEELTNMNDGGADDMIDFEGGIVEIGKGEFGDGLAGMPSSGK